MPVEYLAEAAPAPGETRRVAPGLHWLRLPVPFPPFHVNCWLLEDEAGWLVVDAGMRQPACLAAWESILATRLQGRPITRMLVTHFHIDHVGLAGWLCARDGATLLMPRSEYLQARTLLLEDPDQLTGQQRRMGREAGAPPAYDAWLAAREPFFRPEVAPLPDRYQPLGAGDRLRIGGRDWHVMIGQGHAPEMACLHCPELGLLIAADQILPKISPYIGVLASEPEADPLRRFLDSNQDFLDLPERTLVLPSHGEPFHGLHDRIGWLETHHAERLDTLATACATPITAFEAARVLFPRVEDVAQFGFTIGESLAHLNLLVGEGRLRRSPGADGVTRYRRA
jgi:glyoxylase-like metal-dependent hydrolase (beta-lactamase superfamily II)